MLEDLLVAALNDAVRQVESTTQQKMSGFTAGLNLPPGFKLRSEPVRVRSPSGLEALIEACAACRG